MTWMNSEIAIQEARSESLSIRAAQPHQVQRPNVIVRRPAMPVTVSGSPCVNPVG